jgi:hypothetical protein
MEFVSVLWNQFTSNSLWLLAVIKPSPWKATGFFPAQKPDNHPHWLSAEVRMRLWPPPFHFVTWKRVYVEGRILVGHVMTVLDGAYKYRLEVPG